MQEIVLPKYIPRIKSFSKLCEVGMKRGEDRKGHMKAVNCLMWQRSPRSH